jgi:hypothetical protein
MNGTLKVNRFNGIESWQLTEGSFSISKLPDCSLLNIWVKSNGNRLLPPIEEGYNAEPVLELQTCLNTDDLINIYNKGIEISSSQIKSSDEREFVKLYYYGDIEIFSCQIKIIHQSENIYQILASCVAEDVIHTAYKPKCELNIDCQVIQSRKKTGYWT